MAACTPALQLVRSPPADSNCVTPLPTGACRRQLPFNVRPIAWPLLDLRIATRDIAGPPDPDDPYALPDIRVVPTGLRVEQLTHEGGAPVTTTLALRRHHGCWWVRL